MTATLTEPTRTVREDGISGYAVALMGIEETSAREAVEIVTSVDKDTIKIGIDRVVTLIIQTATNRVAAFSERNVEMIGFDILLDLGDSVTIYPIGHPDFVA